MAVKTAQSAKSAKSAESTESAAAVRGDARELVRRHGRTFAQEAGIRLRDTPAPLYQTLVLSTVLSAPIRASVSTAAARELFDAGWRTASAMASSEWRERVDALGRAHYRRYDESTSTALASGAELVRERWDGDLRELRDEARGDPARVRALVREVPRIGPVGAEIFCREVQGLWPELRPSFDSRALDGAAACDLPTDPDELARLVPPDDLPALAAALVRSTI